MIESEWPSHKKVDPSKIKEMIKSIIRNIRKNDLAGNGKIITLKDVSNKKDSKIIKGFMEVIHEGIFDIEDKKVLIIDDILSTGTSFKDLIRVVNDFNPKEIVGLVIFKGESKKV